MDITQCLYSTTDFLITLDNKFQTIFCICDEYVINLFVCICEVRKGHKKDYLALVLKLCFTMLFYKIGWNIIQNDGLNKNLNTIHWKRMCLVDLFCLEIIFTM